MLAYGDGVDRSFVCHGDAGTGAASATTTSGFAYEQFLDDPMELDMDLYQLSIQLHFGCWC